MSAQIPFSKETFRPLCVKGNAKAEAPTEFDICAVGGANRARLKSIIIASSGLAQGGDWSPSVQDAVIKAFETGGGVFSAGVTSIRGLTAPAALFVTVGLLAELPKGVTPEAQIPITNGIEFAQLCGYWPILAFEVALAIARISGQAEIDPRFFVWLSTSLGMPEIPAGIAAPVERTRGRKGTAASKTSTAKRARGTSKRTRS
jgi:hypothetical protein